VVVLGSAYVRPDKKIIDILQKAELLLIALDSEPDKQINTGAKQSWSFWLKHFSQAKRWCPIEGKDPSEMWKNRKVNLRDWVRVGINKYASINENVSHGTQKEVPKTTYDWQSTNDCEHCRCLIRWNDYPLGGGGTKLFCGYWILEQGKSKKLELSKLKECPKNHE